MIFLTKLWVNVQQGEDEGKSLIFLLPEESYEAGNVVQQEWNQHRCGHIRMTLPVGSPVEFDDEIDVSDNVSGWQYDVENEDDQDLLHLHLCLAVYKSH